MKKPETPEQRDTRRGGENELAGYDSAQRAKYPGQQVRKEKRQQRKPTR